ncbi:MAG: gamma carbonic anhydrase family protein [Spirochaetes bacterium]|nr:gamma carbonic anhydrase family protein [Spirochaetota bacterium]
MIQKFKEFQPKIDKSAYIAETAVIIGNVTIEANASVWPNAVLRGDMAAITVGAGSNIQDGTIVHVDTDQPAKIGKNITIGHNCVIHGCTLEDDCLIGMGSVILNRATVGKNSLIAAGSVVKEGMKIPEDSLVAGAPATIKRKLTDKMKERMRRGATTYQSLALEYKKQ